MATTSKVPSRIRYPSHPGENHRWGFEASYEGAPNDDYEDILSWFKLHLDNDYQGDSNSEDQTFYDDYKNSPEAQGFIEKARTLGKTAADVAADYLSCIWEFVMQDLTSRLGNEFQKSHTLLVVLTVPAIWTDTTKESMKDIARKARLPGDIEIVTEPEAAALCVSRCQGEEGDLSVQAPWRIRRLIPFDTDCSVAFLTERGILGWRYNHCL
jgi:hypothetical protein